MRILAAHDAEGNIHHLVVSPADAPLATVTTEAGLLVTEVEAPEAVFGLDLRGPEDSREELDKVLEYLRDFRVEVGKGKLQRK
jgi:predicted metalloprotease with PDZ domain